MKQSVQVQIAGQSLSIKSDEGPEYVHALAEYVDRQLRELIDGRRSYSLPRVALLVAIQLADELFRERDLRQRFRSRIEARLHGIEEAFREHEANIAELE